MKTCGGVKTIGKANRKSPNAGKEIGRFSTVWGKGKRTLTVNVILKYSDNSVPMEQVTAEFAKILMPDYLERVRTRHQVKAQKLLEECGSKKRKKKPTVV